MTTKQIFHLYSFQVHCTNPSAIKKIIDNDNIRTSRKVVINRDIIIQYIASNKTKINFFELDVFDFVVCVGQNIYESFLSSDEAKGVVIGVVANWLYDKLKNSNVIINGKSPKYRDDFHDIFRDRFENN